MEKQIEDLKNEIEKLKLEFSGLKASLEETIKSIGIIKDKIVKVGKTFGYTIDWTK